MKSVLLRILYYALPALALAVIVLAMLSGPILKRPFGSDDDFPARLQEVAGLALADRWDEAGAAAEGLVPVWKRVRGRLYFTSTTDELEIFDMLLAELQAGIDGRDQVLVRSAHLRMNALWQDLGS